MTLRKRTWLLLAFLLMTGVGGLTGAIWLARVDQYQPRIQQFLEQVSGRQVRIESVSLNLAEGLLLDVAGLEIRSRESKSPPLLTARHLLVGVGLDFLVWNRFHFSSVTLISPQFNVVRYTGHTLLEQARATALDSDRELTRQTGSSLSQMRIGRLIIRDGLVNLADWQDEEDQTLVFDQIQAQLFHISPGNPSPFNATARFHAIPFKVNGQLGPLPADLNPDAMPVILSLEAKTVEFAAIADLLPKGLITASRGYVSALLRGTLQEGLATRTTIELEKFALMHLAAQPVDLTLRQKSLFRLSTEARDLEIQEMFLHVNGTPMLEIKGEAGVWPPRHVDLTATTVRPWVAKALTLPGAGTWSGDMTVDLKITGTTGLALTGVLDLQAMDWQWPEAGLRKEAGVAMTVHPNLRWEQGTWLLQGSTLYGAGDPLSQFRCDGRLWPDPSLTVHADWDLAHLPAFLPMVTHWPVQGRLTLAGRGPDHAPDGPAWSGDLSLASAHWGSMALQQVAANWRFQPGRLILSPFRLAFAEGGILAGGLQVMPDHYAASLVMSGVPVAALPDPASGPALYRRFEGVVQAEGEIAGPLQEDFFPSLPSAGRLQVVLEPGGLLGIGNAALAERPLAETTLSQAGRTFYWEKAGAELLITDSGLRVNDLLIETGQARLSGQGWVEGGQGLDLVLRVDAPWWQDNSPLWAHLFGTLDDLRLKPIFDSP